MHTLFQWQTWAGAVAGVLLGAAILSLTGAGPKRAVPSGPILSECDGHFRDLVIQYEPASKGIVAAVYHDFLGALEENVNVHVVCPNQTAFTDLVATIGPVKCHLLPIVVGHPMTTWSRDRWVALTPASVYQPITLWTPQGEAGSEMWPQRAGDERMGSDIAAALAPTVFSRRSRFYFDGGDFLTDAENVFVMPRVLQRNI